VITIAFLAATAHLN